MILFETNYQQNELVSRPGIFQHLLLLALVVPAFAVVASNDNPINIVDIVASLTFLTLLVGETLADQQQWNFQTKKYALKNAGKPLPPPYSDGFLKSGLWHYSAHPNYASEPALQRVFFRMKRNFEKKQKSIARAYSKEKRKGRRAAI